MAKRKPEHCVMISGGVQCLHCGDIHNIPFPIDLKKMTGLMDAFMKRHARCPKEWSWPQPDMQLPIGERIKFWLQHGERGMSAETIYNHFMPPYTIFGCQETHPHDSDDFRRCYLLLKMIPEWKQRIAGIMKPISPVWSNLVDNWDKLTNILETGLATNAPAKEMNDLMKDLGC